MYETRVSLTKTRLLRDLAIRFEHFAENTTIPNARDRYLKVADLYRQRAKAEEQYHRQKIRSSHSKAARRLLAS